VLYSAVRIKSILRKLEEVSDLKVIAPSDNSEREVVLELLKLPEVISSTIRTNCPHHLSEFVYNLAHTFSKFYGNHHIINEEDEATKISWTTISTLVLKELELVLNILGIDIPEKM